ncbi:DUF1697 domain-containing protein [Patescibacteria group bacterium]|nr:DUF1697 domain-containing protein [Patescibacteria group bacterium]
MIYVALLRGINVGGNAKVEMSKLKATFESIGCLKVMTYINSGNVVFEDKRSNAVLIKEIEAAITKSFDLKIRIVLRNIENIIKLSKEIPLNLTNDSEQKTDVLFLWKEIDHPSVIKKVVINPNLENVNYIEGALVWNIKRKDIAKGSGVKLLKTDLYQHITVRNINTVRKLKELMEKVREESKKT